MILFFSPQDSLEAAGLLRACTGRKAEGRKVAVGILESPFKPAAWLSAAELGSVSSAKAFESVGPSDETLVVMSHARMDRIREISASDFLAVVEGGVKFGAFIDETAKAGLYFPHEPDALMRDATIAEAIMDGTIFRTEGRFGGLREYILSMELVTAGGEIIKTGSRSVKDVTGYDVAGLVLGSGGLCGMISSVTFRLLGAPGTRLFFACSGAAQALRDAAAAIHRDLNPAFMEIFGERASSILLARLAAEAGTAEANNASRALLIGEVQTSEKGREEDLLAKLRSHVAEPGTVQELAPALVGEYRRYPLLALGALKEGDSLLHLAYDEAGTGGTAIKELNTCSLYPSRFHTYIPYGIQDEVGPDGPLIFACSKKYDEYLMAVLGRALSDGLEAGSRPLEQAIAARSSMEVIGRYKDRLCRRRVPLDELSLPVEEPKARGAMDGRLKQQDILNDLAGRIFREFDPQGIMIR